jgi:transglutaminase-like putative cysteine protease
MRMRPKARAARLLSMAVCCSPFLTLGLPATEATAAPGEVLRSYASPCDYPMGLASNGDSFFIADWRYAVIHEIERETGAAVRSFDAPVTHPRGLTFGGGLLWVGDDHNGAICGLNLDTGIVEILFEAPAEQVTGLAWQEGTLFILAKGTIYRVLPDDGTILGYYDAPTPSSGSLCFDGAYLWVSDRSKDELYMTRPEDGKVIGIIDAPGNHATGVAWAGGELWNVDFESRTICEIETNGEETFRLVDPFQARVDFLWEAVNYGPGEVLDLKVAFATPQQAPRQQILQPATFTPAPTRLDDDAWGQPCAVYEIPRIGVGEKVTLGYTVEVEMRTVKHFIRPERVGKLADIPAAIREQYTADASRYRITEPHIRKLAAKIVGDETNAYWIARKIYDYVIEHVDYKLIGGWDVPGVVLKRGSGSCSEYAFTYIALCRAAGLPARYQGSIAQRGDAASIDEVFHRWTQVYLPNYGWVPVDPSAGDKPTPEGQCRYFGHLQNRFLVTTHSGGGSEHLAWNYNAQATYKTTGYANVAQDHYGFWAPLTETAKREGEVRPAPATCITPP